MRIKGIYNSKSKTIETVDGQVYEIELKRVEIGDNEGSNIIMAKLTDSYYDDISNTKFNFVVFDFNRSLKSSNINGVLAKNYGEACDLYLEGIAEDM